MVVRICSSQKKPFFISSEKCGNWVEKCLITFPTKARDLWDQIHRWGRVLLFCRVSQRCAEKRSLRISSPHLDRRRNYACHNFSRVAQTPVMLSGFAGCGRCARGRSECPSCIQICLLQHVLCQCFAVQRNPERIVLITVIAALPYT